ncbi:uncharacterized protein LOC114722818 isoform X2 [Neltuma alba]|uniref:uncharacterized protein LOC114722818 isoform X2 n=1 Tax=Neltuma alba TaxID=207710 RepID=UPI0010A2DF3C|nr:uncharacterized protein LOC114722818 isoform X2 [Prosopis alba]
MNSLIHLSQNPLSVAPERLSSASRVHVSLSHGSLSVSQWCKQSPLVSRPLYVKCSLDRCSEGTKMKEENGKKNNILRGVGRASLVLACVLGAFTLSGIKMNPKPNIAYAAWYQDRSRSSVGSPKKSFLKTDRPDVNEIEGLKLYAMALSMNEDYEDVAVKMLSDECEGFKDSEMSGALTVALIELLLYQKKYADAKQKIEELLADHHYY